jgi:transposase
MGKKRRRFNADFKLKVVLETLKERQSLAQIAQKYQLHPNQVSKWKTDFLAQALDYMNHQMSSSKPENDVEKDQLFAKIGKLQMELEFLKKKLP